jgi:hypothetical protein
MLGRIRTVNEGQLSEYHSKGTGHRVGTYVLGFSGSLTVVESSWGDDQLVNPLVQIQQLCEEENPYEESIRLNTSEQGLEIRQQRTGQWRIRSQLEVPQVESSYEAKMRQQKERLHDLEHYLKQDWRFAGFIFRSRNTGPGRSRDKAIEEFWISIYNGYYQSEMDLLQARGRTLAEYLHLYIIIIHLLGLAPEGWLASPDIRA